MNLEERIRARCSHCKLVQFVSTDKKCRRCHAEIGIKANPVVVVLSVPEPPKPVEKDPVGKCRTYDYWIPVVLLYLRLRSGQSQRQVAEKMRGVRTYISKVESGIATPQLAGGGRKDAAGLPRLCKGLNVPIYTVVRMTEFLVEGK